MIVMLFVNSDIIGGKSEFAFCTFCGDIFIGHFCTGMYILGNCTCLIFLFESVWLDSFVFVESR